MTTRNWGFAAGLAAALALYGTAAAQSPGTGQAGASGRETTDTNDPGVRSGWSGREANQAGGTQTTAPGGQSDATTGSAGSSSATAGSTGSSTSAGTSARAGKIDKGLEEKLQKIHAANQAELQMAQLGAQQAQSPEVKQYAETLQKDHQQMDQQLTQAAQSAGAQLQGKAFEKQQKDAQKELAKLQKKTGQDFDKEFMSRMVKDHEKDLKEVKGAAKDAQKANHPELASALDQAARGIEGHRDRAEQIQKQLKNEKGQARGGSTAAGSMGSSGGSTGSADTGSTGSAGATPSGGAPGTSSGDRAGQRGDTGRGTQPGQESKDASGQGK